MITFLVIAAGLLLAATVVLAVAVRRVKPAAADRDRLNVAIYRERLAELDAELATGRIDTGRHAALRGELQRMLVDDVGDAATTGTAPVPGTRFAAPLVILLLPLLAMGFYLGTGFDKDVRDWLALRARVDQIATLPQPITEQAAQAAGFSLADAARLRQWTLGRRPADADAWLRQGATWLNVEAPVLAVDSLRTAHRLAPDRTDITLALARVVVAMNEGRLNDEGRALFDEVLARQPDHQSALMFYGMAAFEAGDFRLAIDRWQHLRSSLPAGSEGATLLDKSIAVAEVRASQAKSHSIRVHVAWDPSLGAVPGSGTLFVSARAANGPPMPLAAKKLAPSFPVDTTLGDADAVMGGESLSAAGPLLVRARVSMSGNPLPASGDFESDAQTVVPGAASTVNLVIRRRVP